MPWKRMRELQPRPIAACPWCSRIRFLIQPDDFASIASRGGLRHLPARQACARGRRKLLRQGGLEDPPHVSRLDSESTSGGSDRGADREALARTISFVADEPKTELDATVKVSGIQRCAGNQQGTPDRHAHHSPRPRHVGDVRSGLYVMYWRQDRRSRTTCSRCLRIAAECIYRRGLLRRRAGCFTPDQGAWGRTGARRDCRREHRQELRTEALVGRRRREAMRSTAQTSMSMRAKAGCRRIWLGKRATCPPFSCGMWLRGRRREMVEYTGKDTLPQPIDEFRVRRLGDVSKGGAAHLPGAASRSIRECASIHPAKVMQRHKIA